MKVYGIVYRSSVDGANHSCVLADLFSDLDEAKSHVKGLISQIHERGNPEMGKVDGECVVDDDSRRSILIHMNAEVSFEICEMNLR